MTSDGKPYGPFHYQQLIRECAIVAKNFNTSYTDVRDKMTPAELRQLMDLIIADREQQEERVRQLREERERAREQRNRR